MRNIIMLVTMTLFIATITYSTYQKELILDTGITLRLELAPVDPRSLMQGDYMSLNFALLTKINKNLLVTSKKVTKLILALDDNSKGEFIKFWDDEKLKDNEILLNFTYSKSEDYANSKISTTSYFFEEGSGKKYEKAKYGEFKVSKNGEALLVYLLDNKFKIIE